MNEQFDYGIPDGARLFIGDILSAPVVATDAETEEPGHAFYASVNGRQCMIFFPERTSYELLRYLGGRPRRWWHRKR